MSDTKGRTSGLPLSQLEFLILASLAAGPKHGYGIAKDISQGTTGRVSLSAASLYSNLSDLLSNDLVERDSEIDLPGKRRRKTFRITGKGVQLLNLQASLIHRVERAVPGLAEA